MGQGCLSWKWRCCHCDQCSVYYSCMTCAPPPKSVVDCAGTDNDPELQQEEDGHHQQYLLAHAPVKVQYICYSGNDGSCIL